MNDDFGQIFSFIMEVEQLKSVHRRMRTGPERRFENAAEHCWQTALLAWTLAPYAALPVDTTVVIKMLLLHDIVEIDTGDKFVYGTHHDDYENESAAARRIFGLLPPPSAESYRCLWETFETGETPEAIFARAVDRLMPVLQNLFRDGISWREHEISLAQVLEKNRVIERACPALWRRIEEMLKDAQRRGCLK